MRLKQGCRLFWVALVAFVLDRATKVWSLTLEGGAEALPGLLNFQPVRNYGAAFGVFAGRQGLLSALVLLLCAAVLFLLLRFARMPVSARVGLWLIFAGRESICAYRVLRRADFYQNQDKYKSGARFCNVRMCL